MGRRLKCFSSRERETADSVGNQTRNVDASDAYAETFVAAQSFLTHSVARFFIRHLLLIIYVSGGDFVTG